MNEWTPAEQQEHRQDLDDALNDTAWDPDWPELGADLVPPVAPEDREELTVKGGWRLLASQREWLRRQARDERVSEGVVLRRVLADYLAAATSAAGRAAD